MSGSEKPCTVVIIGARQWAENANGSQSIWLWTSSNSPDRSRAWATCSASQIRPSIVSSSAYPCGHTPARVAVVCESRVANRVTSTPRATRLSVSRLATRSHGP